MHWKTINAEIPTVRDFHETINCIIDIAMAALSLPQRRSPIFAVALLSSPHKIGPYSATVVNRRNGTRRPSIIAITCSL